MGLFTRTSELIDFQRGPDHWRYALGDRPVVFGQQTFATVRGLKRGKLARTVDPEQAGLELTMPLDVPVVSLFLPVPSTERVTVKLYWLRSGESFLRERWSGTVASISPSRTAATLKCRSAFTDFATRALNRNWQRGCPLVHYGAGLGECNVNPEAFRIDGAVTASDGATLHAAEWAAKPDGWFRGGFIRWQVANATERRFITDHTGDALTLLTPATIPVGTSVAAYPGCDHTLATCRDKFDNAPNYGGQPNIPEKNPMGGDMIF